MKKRRKYLGILGILLLLGGVYLAYGLTKDENSGEVLSAEDFAEVNIVELTKNKEELTRWLKALGPKVVMAELLNDSKDGTAFDCHQEAHQIGRMAYVVEGMVVFSKGSPACHSGFYHGAMESLLKERGTLNLAANIDEACRSFDTSFGQFECLHGVGHGVLAYNDYDLPEAIKLCSELNDKFAERSCWGGIFMENIVTGQGLGADGAHETQWLNKTDPYFPCNSIGKDYVLRYECYQMQTSWMLSLNNYDYGKVSALCGRADSDMIEVCYKSLGRDIAGNTLRNPSQIVSLCSTVPNRFNYFDKCIEGALNVIVDFSGANLLNQGSELCGRLDTSHKQECYEVLAGRLSGIFTDPRAKSMVCNTFETSYRYLCD